MSRIPWMPLAIASVVAFLLAASYFMSNQIELKSSWTSIDEFKDLNQTLCQNSNGDSIVLDGLGYTKEDCDAELSQKTARTK